jgi:glycerophosphoryl diester phosphodiesterase
MLFARCAGSFRADVANGATALETAVQATADGVAVVSERGTVGSPLRRRSIRVVSSNALPGGTPTLAGLYQECGTNLHVAVEALDTASASAAVATAESAGAAMVHLWLIHPAVSQLMEWREAWPEVRLVNRARLRQLRQGAERRAAELAEAQVDAVSLPYTDWSRGLVALFHRFDRLAFAFGVQQPRELRELIKMGLDAVTTDHIDRMADVASPRSEEAERADGPDANESPAHDQ